MTTIMVTSAGRRRYVLEELTKFSRPGDLVIAADMNPLAPSLATPGVLPAVIEGDDLHQRTEHIRKIAKEAAVDALLSLHDYEAIELSRIAPDLASSGCLFIGPSVEASRISLDKFALASHLEAIDRSLTPATYIDASILDTQANSSPHWVVKDRWGSASSGLAFVKAESVVHHVRQLTRGTWVAQPLTDGVEYNVDLFRDNTGSIVGSSTKRKWAMRAGETDSATVLKTPPWEVVDAASRAVEHLEVIGNVDVDVILSDNGAPAVIDVNPRFGGGYAFSAVAGYRAAEAVWQLARREPVSPLRPEREVTASKHVAVAEVHIPR